MGQSASRKILDDLGAAIQNGRVDQVQEFLRKFTAAQTSRSRDKETQAWQGIDLNALELNSGSSTALQQAASFGQDEIVRLFLEAGCDPNVLDGQKRTALHHATRICGPPRCTNIVHNLLAHQADPCIADAEMSGRTPLQYARDVQCLPCVRALEDRLKLWEGWVDLWEPEMLGLIPTWKPKWLVIAQDRRPNTGRTANIPPLSCATCSHVQPMPKFVSKFQCARCKTTLAVAPSLQMAFYEPRAGDAVRTRRPDSAKPTLVERLPQGAGLIDAAPINEAGGANALDSLFKGKLKQMMQSTVHSANVFGISVKIMGAMQNVMVEHSLRLPTEADRQGLLAILRDPCVAAYQASIATPAPAAALPYVPSTAARGGGYPAAGGGYPAAVQTTPVAAAASGPAARPPPPPPPAPAATAAWFCSRCTYEHTGDLASLTSCTICDAPRGSSPSVDHVVEDAPEDAPQHIPSAPPLEEFDEPAPSPEAHAGLTHAPPPSTSAAVPSAPPPTAQFEPAPGRPATTSSAGGVRGSADMDDDEDKGKCVVCLERQADTAVIPCGHMCGCHECLQGIRASSKAECPMCRGPITSVVKIYQN